LNTNSKHQAGEALLEGSGKMIASRPSAPTADESAVMPTRKKPEAALHAQTRKTTASRRAPSRSDPTQKLVCRYCGSDDLAPSFRKRRDRRCRACFKKRYGSAARRKTGKRTRKAKAKE
jgi:hypothetical protein